LVFEADLRVGSLEGRGIGVLRVDDEAFVGVIEPVGLLGRIERGGWMGFITSAAEFFALFLGGGASSSEDTSLLFIVLIPTRYGNFSKYDPLWLSSHSESLRLSDLKTAIMEGLKTLVFPGMSSLGLSASMGFI